MTAVDLHQPRTHHSANGHSQVVRGIYLRPAYGPRHSPLHQFASLIAIGGALTIGVLAVVSILGATAYAVIWILQHLSAH